MATAFEPPPTYAEVVLFDEQGKHPKFNPIWLKWFVDIAAVLTSIGGGSGTGIDHDALQNLQGGTANQYYHLTAAEHTTTEALIAVNTQLQALAAVNTKLQALAAVTPIAATIVTAKLTGGGANGSMTFVNGLLTASTPAT